MGQARSLMLFIQGFLDIDDEPVPFFHKLSVHSARQTRPAVNRRYTKGIGFPRVFLLNNPVLTPTAQAGWRLRPTRLRPTRQIGLLAGESVRIFGDTRDRLKCETGSVSIWQHAPHVLHVAVSPKFYNRLEISPRRTRGLPATHQRGNPDRALSVNNCSTMT